MLANRSPVQLFPAGVKGQSVTLSLVFSFTCHSCMGLGSFGRLDESPPSLLELVHQKWNLILPAKPGLDFRMVSLKSRNLGEGSVKAKPKLNQSATALPRTPWPHHVPA